MKCFYCNKECLEFDLTEECKNHKLLVRFRYAITYNHHKFENLTSIWFYDKKIHVARLIIDYEDKKIYTKWKRKALSLPINMSKSEILNLLTPEKYKEKLPTIMNFS